MIPHKSVKNKIQKHKLNKQIKLNNIFKSHFMQNEKNKNYFDLFNYSKEDKLLLAQDYKKNIENTINDSERKTLLRVYDSLTDESYNYNSNNHYNDKLNDNSNYNDKLNDNSNNHSNIHSNINSNKHSYDNLNNYLFVDLGGSTLELTILDSDSNFLFRKTVKILRNIFYEISIFKWIANQIEESKEFYSFKKLSTFFIFSYPLLHSNIKSASIINMSKEFNFLPVIPGEDPGVALKEECEKIGVFIDIKAILNDCTATLLTEKSNLDDTCVIGLVGGTGCNAAFTIDYKTSESGNNSLNNFNNTFNNTSNNLENNYSDNHFFVLNAEWGAFDSPHLKKSFIDQLILQTLPKVHQRPISVMTGGLRLLEIVNEVINTVTGEFNRFSDVKSIFDYISDDNFCNESFNQFSNNSTDRSFNQSIQSCIKLVLKRQQSIVASLLFGAIQLQGKKRIKIVLNGSLYSHKITREYLIEEILELMEVEREMVEIEYNSEKTKLLKRFL